MPQLHHATRNRAQTVLTALLIMLLGPACGGGKGPASEPQPPEGEILRSKSATLRILPETYLAGGSARRLSLHEREESGEIVLELHAADAAELKALYLQLDYDAAQLSPAGVESAGRFAEERETLQLSLATQPGVLQYAEQCIRPEEPSSDGGRKGFSGDGLLCSFRLAQRPFAPLQREVMAPTIAQRSQSILSLDNDALTLSWGYANNGDYNQNGTVAVTDLTPIGAHFGADVPGGDQSSIQAVIDGNGDGSVGVADLTAIGLNFQVAVNSYNIYASSDGADLPADNGGPNGPGAELQASLPFSAVQGDQFSARRSFSFVLAEAQAGWFYWVRPNDAADGAGIDGTPSNSVSFGGDPDNLDPLAELSADPSSGGVPLDVALDASGSSDPDGATGTIADIVQFQWDFDGNGVVDDVTTEPSIVHTYQNAGLIDARVKVIDAGAAFASASVQLGIGIAGNDSPLADIKANFTQGEAPFSVIFDASDSEDGEGNRGNVTYEWDFEGDGIFDLDSDFDPSAPHVYNEAGVFNARVRVTDDIGQQATASIEITVLTDTGNQPPGASLEPDPLVGDAPGNQFIELEFDISGCTDADGFVKQADLDTNGDGLPERTFFSSDGSTLPSVLSFFAPPGVSTAILLVTDDQGAQASTSAEVRVSINGNFPPATVLEADPEVGDAPLLVSFDASGSTDIDGSIVGFEFNFDFNADFENFEADADGLASHAYENGGEFLVLVHAVDNEGLKSTASLEIIVNAPNNQPPQASFTLTPDSGDGPLLVTADASASSDPDGSLVSFEWDLYGSDTFAIDDQKDDSQPFTFLAMNKGVTTISLKVTDSDGATDITTRELNLNTGWEFGPIASVSGLSGLNSGGNTDFNVLVSLAGIKTGQGSQEKAGLAFSPNLFFGEVLERIKYTECSLTDPLSWSTPVTVHERPDAENGLEPVGHALQDVGGRPALAFAGSVAEDGFTVSGGLFYLRANDSTGSSWPEPLELTGTNDEEDGIDDVLFPSLIMVEGQPAVSCLHQSIGILHARAEDTLGSDWPKLVEAVALTQPAQLFQPRLIAVEGIPSLIYAEAPTFNSFFSPMFVQSDSVAGVDWGLPEQIADGEELQLRGFGNGGVPRLFALTVKNLPAAAYSSINTPLYYERSEEADGGFAAAGTEALQSAPRKGVSFALADGRPCFVYGEFHNAVPTSSRGLFLLLSKDSTGSEWHTPEPIVLGPGADIALSAMVTVNKDLLVVYGDADDQQLKAALFRNFEAF